MKRPALLSTMALALLCCAGALSGTTAVADPAVLAQDLVNLRASGKVMSALWTARKDRYTLQLVFPITFPAVARPTRTDAAVDLRATPQPVPASVQVWLLKANGTQVFPAQGSSPPKPDGLPAGGRTISYSYTYSFPVEESRQAVAVAVRINDDFYIDQLQPLR